jgi:hypothetical protein
MCTINKKMEDTNEGAFNIYDWLRRGYESMACHSKQVRKICGRMASE